MTTLKVFIQVRYQAKKNSGVKMGFVGSIKTTGFLLMS